MQPPVSNWPSAAALRRALPTGCSNVRGILASPRPCYNYKEVVGQALAMLEIDALGLDKNDRRILETLIHKFNGQAVGLTTLAAARAKNRTP